MLHQPRIFNRPDAVPDPLRPDRQRVPNILRIRCFTRVAHRVQPAIPRPAVQFREIRRRRAPLESAQPERDHPIGHALPRQLDHRSRRRSPELPHRVQNPANRQRRASGFPLDGLKNRGEILRFP